jgi:electron transport complex protein RnfG
LAYEFPLSLAQKYPMDPGKRRIIALALGLLLMLAVVGAQTFFIGPKPEPIDVATEEQQALLSEVFPEASIFSVKGGRLPHHKAYRADENTGENILLGFAFMTHEVEPEEWAYESELEILVGLTLGGAITGIKVVDHYEPFGYFSIDTPDFSEQFKGKSILDAFEEGRDVDAVSRATISIESAARVIRKSARQIARQHLKQERPKP